MMIIITSGTPLLESDPGLFTPPVHSNSTTQQDQLYQHEQEGLRETMPMIRDVKAEAEVARSNARLLIEALAFTSPAEMEANAIIQVSSFTLLMLPSHTHTHARDGKLKRKSKIEQEKKSNAKAKGKNNKSMKQFLI
jgi:hypothetical protein